jgi:hypothetical protein
MCSTVRVLGRIFRQGRLVKTVRQPLSIVNAKVTITSQQEMETQAAGVQARLCLSKYYFGEIPKITLGFLGNSPTKL